MLLMSAKRFPFDTSFFFTGCGPISSFLYLSYENALMMKWLAEIGTRTLRCNSCGDNEKECWAVYFSKSRKPISEGTNLPHLFQLLITLAVPVYHRTHFTVRENGHKQKRLHVLLQC
ncbi:hypothetical protein BaRGS_00019904 [Batillaria attramentaria]|uniref:Uncharacterized protein n=1 Tax=Batillaria attramentaria TaxID=370345 RepID=A0ABD0KNY2_9CAEN